MTKPLTVRQMVNRLQKLVDEGHGSAPVLSRYMNPAVVRFDPRDVRDIGPSQWDNKTHAWTDETTIGTVIV